MTSKVQPAKRGTSPPAPVADDTAHLDLDAVDLRISRGSVPASKQLAEALKSLILAQHIPAGTRLPSEQELIRRSGLSRVTVRSAASILESQGYLVRRQGLGTFVATPVNQELTRGVRTITEVLLSQGITPRVKVLSHEVIPAPPRVRDALGRSEVLCIRRLYSDDEQPLALVTLYLPADLGDAVTPLLNADSPTETTYTMWEQRLGIRLGEATHTIHAAGASACVANALGVAEGAPILVLERVTYNADGGPLEVVVFHHRPERYGFSVTLSREAPGAVAGIAER